MANNERELERWVDDRLAALTTAPGWHPDAAAALPRARERTRQGSATHRRRAWILTTATAGLAMAAIAVWQMLEPKPVHCADAPVCSSVPAAAKQNPVPPRPPLPGPPITCELFVDYECPPCAVHYTELVSGLTKDFVENGRVRLVHRDFPLPSHAHARDAARYAKAAGRLGHYDDAAAQLFKTQRDWSADGDIASRLAEALPADAMAKIRDMVANDPTIDAAIDEDIAVARAAGLHSTPALVVITKNGRQPITAPAYSALKSHLDRILEQQ